MSKTSDIVLLIRKKMDGTISDHELLCLQKWRDENPLHAQLLKITEDEETVLEDVRDWLTLRDGEDKDTWFGRLESKTRQKIRVHEQSRMSRRPVFLRMLPYAALLLAISTISFLFYQNYTSDGQQIEIHDLSSGTNKAFVTLSDGSVIELSQDQGGVVMGEGLTYEDGTLIADLDNQDIVYATIVTPRGGQYQITFADGTKVWLNADTKLTYPSRFVGESRMVELEGEAYFEVESISISGNRVPFLVKTAQQEVEVLGTEFNIKAYTDDNEDTQTTLVEGAVQLHAQGTTMLLHPGEQGVNDEQGLGKKKVDISPYIAWKNNEFVFDETELQEALKILSRWYDFDINMASQFPKTYLYGSIRRNKSLAEALKIMESSGLKFKIERIGDRNRLTVLN